MKKIRQYTQQNRRAWDEIAAVRAQTQPSASFFSSGHGTLPEFVLAAAGNVSGANVLQLMCATGEDTLSWAGLGAQAVGVDISPRQIEIARQKAAQAGLPARFYAADVYNLPDDLMRQDFDLVYLSLGIMVWLPDLNGWAQACARCLKPGGRLILYEEHPVAIILSEIDGHMHIDGDYFSRSKPAIEYGWGHFQGGDAAIEEKYEFSWPLGDIITALAQAGLFVVHLEEFPSSQAWRFGAELEHFNKFPGEYLLVSVFHPIGIAAIE
jgi:SAM-dependent methyltransferase